MAQPIRKRKADPKMKDTVREMLRRLSLGILQPRFCSYTEKEGTIEFGVICHILKATSEADRSRVADCVKELFQESYFRYDKKWIVEEFEEDGEMVTYTYPPILITTLE